MYIVVQHRVRDFDAWKSAFDEHRAVRERYGCRSERVYRGLDDPHEVTVALEWQDRAHAEAFYNDPSLREAMERGGVVSEPSVTFLEQIDTWEAAQQRAA
jgi:quinol monooxygenase YgiN